MYNVYYYWSCNEETNMRYLTDSCKWKSHDKRSWAGSVELWLTLMCDSRKIVLDVSGSRQLFQIYFLFWTEYWHTSDLFMHMHQSLSNLSHEKAATTTQSVCEREEITTYIVMQRKERENRWYRTQGWDGRKWKHTGNTKLSNIVEVQHRWKPDRVHKTIFFACECRSKGHQGAGRQSFCFKGTLPGEQELWNENNF